MAADVRPAPPILAANFDASVTSFPPTSSVPPDPREWKKCINKLRAWLSEASPNFKV